MGHITCLSNLLTKAGEKHPEVKEFLASTPGWSEYVVGDLAAINEVEISYLGGMDVSPALSMRSLENGVQLSDLRADELDNKEAPEISLKKSMESTTPKIIKRSLALNKRLSDMDDCFDSSPTEPSIS
mmetsp:Transcript_12894/g.23966  ORF Transcript_12894/g.23966 Transcript_12894/m.23966 type:complete len:128 (-) Transcript_12894:33-416(-)